MKINIIAAVSSNNVIGNKGQLPWHISEDLKHFKDLTTGHAVLMGRRTWESLPIKPLPNRCNMVISSTIDNDFISCDIAYFNESLPKALTSLDVIKSFVHSDFEVFIIGGTGIYKEALDLGIVDTMYITHIHSEYEGDTYFPNLDWSKWIETGRQDFKGYSFVVYNKKPA